MFAAIFGGLSLFTLWYLNVVRPRLRQRALETATKTVFLVPSKTQHDCGYAPQDQDEHILREISLPPNSEAIIDFVTHFNVTFSFSEVGIGFVGDLSKKPYFTRYFNRYVEVGKGREIDPALETTDDFIDKHHYYHHRWPNSRTITAGTVLSMAFKIKTIGEGTFPLHVYFMSNEIIGEEKICFVTVETAATVQPKCIDPEHQGRECTQGLPIKVAR